MAHSKDQFDPVVYIVDDDDEHRTALGDLLCVTGCEVLAFARPSELIERLDRQRPGCVIVDVRLPEVSGIALIDRLAPLPVIVITGYGDIDTAVRSFKSGAAEFLEKPVHHQVMIDTVQRNIDRSCRFFYEVREKQLLRERIESLTERQLMVLSHVLTGSTSKEIGQQLDLSPRTVEKHRAAAKEKLGDLLSFDTSTVLHELADVIERRRAE